MFLENDNALKKFEMTKTLEWFGNQIPGGFFIYKESDLKLIYVNEVTLLIFGCDNMSEFIELTNNTFKGMVYHEDYDKIQASIDAQINDSERKYDYVEYRIVRKDKEIRWVDDYGHLAYLEGYGNVYYVFISDITDKYLLKSENQQRINAYTLMVEQYDTFVQDSLSMTRSNLTTGIIEDVRGKDIYNVDKINGSFIDMHNARKQSILIEEDKIKYDELFSKENLINRFNNGNNVTTFVTYCKRDSGKKYYVKFSRTLTIDPHTKNIISFGLDVDYNKEVVSDILHKKVLAEQYDMVSYILDNNYSVVIGDAKNISKGSIFPVKREGLYTEYIKNQVIITASKAVHDIEELEEKLSIDYIFKMLEKNESYYEDVTCIINGEEYIKRFSYYLVDKKTKFFILLKSDITDLLKEERKKSAILFEALEEAKQANAAKTAFLSNMSHEIRTPMNAILGLDDIALNDGSLNQKTKEYLLKIGESARHLLGIINDILDMSRIESGKLFLKKEEFSIMKMIDELKVMIQSQSRDKNLEFICNIKGDFDKYYYGDDAKIKQILINILSNAVKFTDEGHIIFNIEKVSSFSNQTTIKFEIIDSGIGMSEEFLSKIFIPFTQEDMSKTNKYGSTGLGMAITKNLVDAMDGTISVISKKNRGSKFTVVLTLKNVTKANKKYDKYGTINLKTLLIDDNLKTLDMVKNDLEEYGIKIDIGFSDEIIDMIKINSAKQEAYNFIIIDEKINEKYNLENKIKNLYNDMIIFVLSDKEDINNLVFKKPLDVSSLLDEYFNIKNNIYNHVSDNYLSGKKILLAEDVLINAEIITELLNSKNIITTHVENGKLAYEKFMEDDNYFDAILMDIRMPLMDGLESAALIRKSDKRNSKTIPIIALTANAFDEDVKLSLQVGMNAHLSKPIDPKQLFKILKELIYKNEVL